MRIRRRFSLRYCSLLHAAGVFYDHARVLAERFTALSIICGGCGNRAKCFYIPLQYKDAEVLIDAVGKFFSVVIFPTPAPSDDYAHGGSARQDPAAWDEPSAQCFSDGYHDGSRIRAEFYKNGMTVSLCWMSKSSIRMTSRRGIKRSIIYPG